MSNKGDTVIVSAKRSAIGSFCGSLSSMPAHDIGANVIKSVLADTGVKPEDVSEVISGQVLTAAQGQNPARQASINAGLPNEITAWTINQVCGSGLRSVALGCQAIAAGTANIIIAGGQENMSLAPHCGVLRNGYKMGPAQFVDTMVFDGLTDIFNSYHMGITAENIAEKFSITRQEQDEFATNSQNKAEEAIKSGAFKEEIAPITLSTRKGETVFDTDEFPREGVDVDQLAKLKAAFKKEGTVTAGNASGINDGAAFVMITTREEAEKQGWDVLATVKSFAQAGVDPSIMGTGPIPASKKALEKAGWTVKDLDLVEANEAFAAQALCVNKEMGWDPSIVNVNGGAISLGHPIGASGARVLTTLLHAMKARDAKKGLATLCVGGGMGVAMCVER